MEPSVIHNSVCDTLFSKAFLLKPREARFYWERRIDSFGILGSCEAYGKQGMWLHDKNRVFLELSRVAATLSVLGKLGHAGDPKI